MDELGNFVDRDFVRPPSINPTRSSSLIVSLANSTKLLSEWLMPRKQIVLHKNTLERK